MPKNIYYKEDARKRLKSGIDAVADAVKVTLGPMGRTVIIDTAYGHKVTKDGVSVAKEVILEDEIENLGASVIKEVSLNANELAGDGTTTATVLAQAIITEGLKSLNSGCNPVDLKRGIDKAVDFIVSNLKKNSIQVDDTMDSLTHIATISANNDPEIGKLIASAYKEMGRDAVITVEKGKGLETTVENIKGYRFKGSNLSKYFINDDVKMISSYINPSILIYNGNIGIEDVAHIEMLCNALNGIPLVIITTDIEPSALEHLIVRKLAKKLSLSIVKAPYRLDRRIKAMEDIAAITGGNCLHKDKGHGLSMINEKYLGKADKIIIDKKNTMIMNGRGTKARIEKRIQSINNDIEKLNTDAEKKAELERIAKMTNGISIIKVGSLSEIELGEKKDRVDDALRATKAALDEGYGPGSSLSLIKASKVMVTSPNKDEQMGIDIVSKAVEKPFKQIMENAGLSPDVILSKVKNAKGKNAGYNVKTGAYVDMLIEGIIDPTKVSRVALENAASVAGTILTTECALVRTKDTVQKDNFNF